MNKTTFRILLLIECKYLSTNNEREQQTIDDLLKNQNFQLK